MRKHLKFNHEMMICNLSSLVLCLVQKIPSEITKSLQIFPIINIVYFVMLQLKNILKRIPKASQRLNFGLRHSLDLFDYYFKDK
jgi:hypothetical protein